MGNSVLDDLLSYPKLIKRIEESDNPALTKKKVVANFNEMKADYSPSYLKSMAKFFDATLPRLYDGVSFNENETDLNALLEEASVVLVPNHQSHADYIAINYKFFKQYKRMLYVAGGDNLNIFPIGKIFRKSGCFFIRRSFQNDILYKFTMEAYLFALLKRKEPIEFFFEGGRTRSGKLRPPKYGLYQMLLEAHSHLPDAKERGLAFVPVSIAHEYVPEQKALAKEMMGGKKVKESTGQLFGLFKLMAYQFGKIHISLGKPQYAHKLDDPEQNKLNVRELAFKCFRSVGDQMVITPTNLLVLILLDEPSGALKWNDIILKAQAILEYCQQYDIPFTEGLKASKLEDSIGRAMDILIGNNKVDVIGQSEGTSLFYAIKKNCRGELLFFKNTIVHHFIIPWTISLAWFNVFSGEIDNVDDLKAFFVKQRDMLKMEFYLPTVKEYYAKTLRILSNAVGREITNLQDAIEFTNKDLYEVASKLSLFARSLTYINEAYFVSALTLESFQKDGVDHFKAADYMKRFVDVFKAEILSQRIIRFAESQNVELMKTALTYFEQIGVLGYEDNSYVIANRAKLDEFIQSTEKTLKDQLKLNFKVV
ncbi:1-acyl-sn-glycerol-3-phosphate acyltransferase [Halobacteriovorax sp. CON-3]|uniref:1-acyl-sn-glycerol-3-phosphate acyltransferase n=1 Tax=Halobacteriovorax sp. CON-3 TaxID=3157710 RepID=UPI00371D32E5